VFPRLFRYGEEPSHGCLAASICFPTGPSRVSNRSILRGYYYSQSYILSNRHLFLPSNLNGIELHAHCKYGLVLAILELWVGPNDGAVVVVVHFLVIGGNELAPPLFPRLALHFLLIDGGFRVEVGKVLLEVFVDLIVELGEP
jgi:hypothetical protein